MANTMNGYLEDRASVMKAAGTASAGSSMYAAAADHVHPSQAMSDMMVTAPASASADGKAGSIAFDSGYIYVCVADNTWKRAALSTWT